MAQTLPLLVSVDLTQRGQFAGTIYVDFPAFVGIMLLKVPWFTPGFSYCRWWGVECCLTASESALPACSGGLQSVGTLALAGQHFISFQVQTAQQTCSAATYDGCLLVSADGDIKVLSLV